MEAANEDELSRLRAENSALKTENVKLKADQAKVKQSSRFTNNSTQPEEEVTTAAAAREANKKGSAAKGSHEDKSGTSMMLGTSVALSSEGATDHSPIRAATFNHAAAADLANENFFLRQRVDELEAGKDTEKKVRRGGQ